MQAKHLVIELVLKIHRIACYNQAGTARTNSSNFARMAFSTRKKSSCGRVRFVPLWQIRFRVYTNEVGSVKYRWQILAGYAQKLGSWNMVRGRPRAKKLSKNSYMVRSTWSRRPARFALRPTEVLKIVRSSHNSSLAGLGLHRDPVKDLIIGLSVVADELEILVEESFLLGGQLGSVVEVQHLDSLVEHLHQGPLGEERQILLLHCFPTTSHLTRPPLDRRVIREFA